MVMDNIIIMILVPYPCSQPPVGIGHWERDYKTNFGTVPAIAQNANESHPLEGLAAVLPPDRDLDNINALLVCAIIGVDNDSSLSTFRGLMTG